MPNRLTDVGPREFGNTLESNGWNRVEKDWGIVYEKDGARYQLRDHAKTHGGWTAEFFKPGSKKADLKIRLGED